jgi:hypothetical protein
MKNKDKFKLFIFKIKLFFYFLANYEPFIYKNKALAIKRAKRFERKNKIKMFVVSIEDYYYELMTEQQWESHKALINDPIWKIIITDKLVYGKE